MIGWLTRTFLPVLTVLAAIVVIWYAAAIWMNQPFQRDTYVRQGVDWTLPQLVRDTWNQDRPVLPTPHQIWGELERTVFNMAPTSRRSLVYHAQITLSSTLLGFAMGTVLGILIAVGIVHVKSLDQSLMPWIIASQTVPILAIAPMIIVVLGAIGLSGLVPKAIISSYLAFFPVAVGMVKGLRSPEVLHLDLLRTYSASPWQVFWRLRWPSALPFLFPAMRVAIAIALVGAIVAELPTGAVAGLGARLLSGFYFGQTLQIWAALIVAAVLAGLLVSIVGLANRLVLWRMGMSR
ncbi:MAG: ABC transporter permease [Geminicoccaceae bacterium]|nr:MAG: ABC transporter permease [Geminicoccaceae bacterium]